MTSPNPKRDKRSAWAWLKDWVDSRPGPLAMWFLLSAGAVFALAVGLWLLAVWIDDGIKFGLTGLILAGLSIILLCVSIAAWPDDNKKQHCTRCGRTLS